MEGFTNLDDFMAAYQTNLLDIIANDPRDYAYGVEEVPGVVKKMRAAFIAGNYNKDGRAIRRTCNQLKIKYTYAAINAYLRGEQANG